MTDTLTTSNIISLDDYRRRRPALDLKEDEPGPASAPTPPPEGKPARKPLREHRPVQLRGLPARPPGLDFITPDQLIVRWRIDLVADGPIAKSRSARAPVFRPYKSECALMPRDGRLPQPARRAREIGRAMAYWRRRLMV